MAEFAAARNNALPYPVYGLPYVVTFPLLDADGDPVSPSSPDSEISKNGDTFADCTNEAVEIATSSGICYLSLTGTELTTDIATIRVQSTGAKTTVLALYPRKLVSTRAGTSASGGVSTSTIVLDASASAVDDFYNGMIVAAVIDGTTEVRMITDYTGSTQTATVVPDWNTAPDNNDTFTVYLPEGVQIQQSNVTQFGGSNGTFSSGRPEVNATHAAGTAWGSGAITAGSIATGAITNAKFAAGAIDAAAIADNAIDAGTLAADCITAAKIANGAIDAATFAADVDAEVLSWIVDDATRIDASALNTLSSHDPGETIMGATDTVVLANSAHGGTSATLRLGGSTSTPALYVTNSGGDAAKFEATGSNGIGFHVDGDGSGAGLRATGGASGNGAHFSGGASGGNGLRIFGASAHALHAEVDANDLHGAYFQGQRNGHGICAVGANGDGTGTGDGLNVTSSGVGVGLRAGSMTVTSALTAGTNAIPWNASWDAEVQSEVADALAVYDPPTNAEMEARTLASASYATASAISTVAGYIDTEISTIITHLTDIKGATWASTDSLEAIRDRGDAAWITATGFSTHSAADVWAVGTRVLTAGTNIVLAKDTGVTGFTDLSAGDVRTAVGLASANLDTQLGTLATQASVNTIDDFLDTEIAAIKAKTDNLPSDPADQSAVEAAITSATSELATQSSVNDLPTNAELATALASADDATLAAIAALSIPTANQNAAALLDLANGIESGITLRQALRLMAAALAGKRSNAGTSTEQYDAAGNVGTARIVGNLDADGNGTPTLTP